MRKPKFLYHASPYCDLKTIKPRNRTAPSGFKNGLVVFATDNFSFSTQFLVAHDDSWANGGAFGNTYYFVISDIKRFQKVDVGGCVYLIPSQGFQKYNKHEWFSNKPVKTQSKVKFDSGFDAMIIAGVQVYVVNPRVYKEIQSSEDHGAHIMNGIRSENEKRGLRVEKLEFYRGSKKLL